MQPSDAQKRNLTRALVLTIVFAVVVLCGSYFVHDWRGPVRILITIGFSMTGVFALALANALAGFRVVPYAAYQYLYSAAFVVVSVLVVHAAGSTTTPSVVLLVPCIIFPTLLWGAGAGLLATGMALLSFYALIVAEGTGIIGYAPLYPSKAPLVADWRITSVSLLWVTAFVIFSYLFSLYFKRLYAQETARREQAIAELQQANAELARMQRVLAEREAIAAVATLASGAAHELNNPLATAYSLTQSLLEDVQRSSTYEGRVKMDVSEITEALRRSLAEQQRARAIVSDLYDVTEQDVAPRESVDLDALVREEVARLRHERSAACIELNLSDRPAFVHGSPHQLAKSVRHLLTNALDAVEGLEAPRITVETRLRDDRIELIVRDNGPGISKELRGEVFLPFFTTKRHKKATGLGLYVVHRVAERHGGRAFIGENAGPGAVVHLELPVKKASC